MLQKSKKEKPLLMLPTKKFNALKQKAASEIESLKVELAKSAAEMTAQRDNTAKELSDMKAKYAAVVQDGQKVRANAVLSEAVKLEGKSEIEKIDEEIAKLIRKGTKLRRDRKDQFGAIGHGGQMKWIHGRLA